MTAENPRFDSIDDMATSEEAAMRYGFGDREETAMEVVELPEVPEIPVPTAPAGSLQNPHIVDPANIPGTAPRGPGASAKGYFRYPKQHGEAA
jgi:hypothetical protein